ncbi:MAG: CehA/McbA family metallohydrolase [Pirellulales bacterium]
MHFPFINDKYACLLIFLFSVGRVAGHEHSLSQHKLTRLIALAQAARLAEDQQQVAQDRPNCRLSIDLIDAQTKQPIAGMVRITHLDSGKALHWDHEIHRSQNWYALPACTTLKVPRTILMIEAFHGLETETRVIEVDVTTKRKFTLQVALKRFYQPRDLGLASGNTHLHLMEMTHSEALRYLRIVPQADGLDLVFLSHLRRLPDESKYISNTIVVNSFQENNDLTKLSQHRILYSNGEEHRHNFGRSGEGYGHVMFLDMPKLIRPVSIGPGIMGGKGTDGIPLQRGIQEARKDGDTVIWCHNTRGYEDVPNWIAELLDAQNINDGSTGKSYEDSFYKYLNLGKKVPFSTGTDWLIYDFSRVYVPVEGQLTSKKWRAALTAGKSYITNGPLLEFTVEDRTPGDTISLTDPGELRVRGSAIGRNDFQGLELIHNGAVIHTTNSKSVEGHFTAEMNLSIQANGPGWVALRIPPDVGKNEFGQDQFAHTSPVYMEMDGKRIFRVEIAKALIEEIEGNMALINKQGNFANNEEWNAVMNVHRKGIETLRKQLRSTTVSVFNSSTVHQQEQADR